MAFGLPNRKHRSGGVLDDGHAANIENVEWSHQHLAAKRGCPLRSFVGALNGNVEHPVWRHACRLLLWTQGVRGSCIATAEPENCVEVVWAHGHVVRLPPKQPAVEVLCGILVGCS